jgi:tight adherence protein B
VVLAIDTSNSVRGAALAAAVAAAKRFVDSLPPEVHVGLVTFSDQARVLQPLTTDHASLLTAIDSLGQTHLGTALYDGLVAATRMFPSAGQHNIVVLTDGADTVSQASLESVAAAAKHAKAAIFSVGLVTRASDTAVLEQLAQETGGTYAPADRANLAGVYEGLARGLSQQFVVTYRSHAPRGSQATVTAVAGGVRDSASVLIPRPISTPAPGLTPPGQPILSGTTGLTVVLILCFLAAFLLVVMFLLPGTRQRRDRDLARRMSVRKGEPDAPDRPDRGMLEWIPTPIVDVADRLIDRGGIGERLERRLEQAGVRLSGGEFAAAMAVGVVVGILAGAALSSSLFTILLVALVFGCAPAAVLMFVSRRRSTSLQNQLPDMLMILASSLRAGHSFLQALDMVAKEIGEPGAAELTRVVAEIRLGRSIEDAMTGMADRIGSLDFNWAVMAINIQREVGGNLAEILDTVAETLRERQVVRRQIRALAAEGQLSIGILAGLPFLMALYISRVNPGYLNLLFSTTWGRLATIGAGTAMGFGIIWMRRIVKIDV